MTALCAPLFELFRTSSLIQFLDQIYCILLANDSAFMHQLLHCASEAAPLFLWPVWVVGVTRQKAIHVIWRAVGFIWARHFSTWTDCCIHSTFLYCGTHICVFFSYLHPWSFSEGGKITVFRKFSYPPLPPCHIASWNYQIWPPPSFITRFIAFLDVFSTKNGHQFNSQLFWETRTPHSLFRKIS